MNLFGTTSPMKNEKIKNKAAETNLKKYGSRGPMGSKEVQQKSADTLFKNFGVRHVSQSQELIDKRIKTYEANTLKRVQKKYKELYNVNIISKDSKNETYTIQCDCGEAHTFDIKYYFLCQRIKKKDRLCTICHPINEFVSNVEIQMQEYIKTLYKGKIKFNSRKILKNRFELDVYISDLKIAFEFNGLT